MFASLDGAIQEFSSEVNTKLKCLTKYKSSLSEEGRVLMDKYRAKRSKGFIKNSIKSIDIPIQEICNFITQSIKLDTSAVQEQENKIQE